MDDKSLHISGPLFLVKKVKMYRHICLHLATISFMCVLNPMLLSYLMPRSLKQLTSLHLDLQVVYTLEILATLDFKKQMHLTLSSLNFIIL